MMSDDQRPRLRNNLYCVGWDVKLYYTILNDDQQWDWTAKFYIKRSFQVADTFQYANW